MNTPNKLTILRTILVPVFIVAYLDSMIPYNNYIAAAIFIVASLTDFFDGYLARKYNLITNFGKFLDPLADKLLVNSALMCFLLVPDNPVPFWVVFVIIMRDFIINGFRLVASDNNAVIAADFWGKIKTTVQMIMVIIVLFDFDMPFMNIIELIFIYASVILTVLSLADCLYKNRKVLMGAPKASQNVNSQMAGELVDCLKFHGYRISCAESCTGGMLASTIIDVAGSSEILRQSVITYCDDAKHNILGVSRETLDQFTAVSEQTAGEMAEGINSWADSDVGISVTGIAGPDGGSREFPVGLVYIGVNFKNETNVRRFVFKGGRNDVRKQAVNAALKLTLDIITEYNK